MNDHEPEDGFIGMLLEETYKNVSKEESSAAPNDLYKYFALKNRNVIGKEEIESTLENFLIGENIKIFEFKYQQQTACYRFRVRGKDIDVPSNWSVFEHLHRVARRGESTLIIVNSENDYDALFKILLPFAECKSELVFFVNEKKIYMVFIPENKQSHIQWMKNYLDIGYNSLATKKIA